MPTHVNPGAISKLFCLAETAILPSGDWSAVRVGDRILTHGPNLPVHEVELDGEKGYLLGWPAAPNTSGHYDLESIGEVGGRWVLITNNYIIPDPLATYSVVYSTENRIAAASSIVIPEDVLELDTDLNTALRLPETDNWYPFGLTPWQNLTRLLPNHILDLQTHTASRRHRPVAELDDETSMCLVAENLRKSVMALVDTEPVTILATAGNDSRILLAATQQSTNIELLTFVTANSSTDVQIAGRLSQLTGFGHKILEVRRSEPEESLWFDLVGRCVAGASLKSAALKLSLAPERFYLKGIGGEIGRRTNYYRPGDESRASISAEALLQRLHLPNHDRLLEAARGWLAGLSEYQNAAELIEIVYRENRIGAWASPQLHGDSVRSVWIFPLNQQKTIDALRFLSAEVKNSRVSPGVIINQLWPELLTVPVNPLSRKQKAIKIAKRIRTRILPVSK